MIKNLGKFKQWTGEKFGGAKVTLQTEDFQRLEKETEHRREGYDKVVESLDLILSYLVKKKSSPEDGKSKMMPLESFGSCLSNYGNIFPQDSALGIALTNVGKTESSIAKLQETLASNFKSRYMSVLENGHAEYKEYDTLKKKLQSRRLDFDSKLNKLNKAKKEKPELEQEMQAAKIKYEDTEHDLIQKMAYLQEFENEHRDALLSLVESQLDYHTKARELLLALKSNWNQGNQNTETVEILDKVIPRKQEEFVSSKIMSRESSLDTFNSTVSQPYKPEHYRKALFDFTGQSEDELSIKVGDIITVINEIDIGWWLGELNSKKGIFPVNYTELYNPQSQLLPPLPKQEIVLEPTALEPTQVQPTSNLEAILEHSIIQPTVIDPIPTPVPSTTIIDSTHNNEHSKYKQPTHQQQSLPDLSTNTTVRRPPPPPASISSPSLPVITRTKSVAIRPPPPPPPLSQNCHECSCSDFIDNVFKSGQCNNCLHPHIT